MLQSLRSYEEFNYKLNFFRLVYLFTDNGTIDHLEYVYQVVVDNLRFQIKLAISLYYRTLK